MGMHAVSMVLWLGGVPSSISGKPVRWSTAITGTPAASMALALPPVDTISYPASVSPCMMRWPLRFTLQAGSLSQISLICPAFQLPW